MKFWAAFIKGNVTKRTVLGIILLLLMVTVGCYQEPEQPLQLTIKSDKEVYEVGENIIIESKFKNISNKSIRLSDYYRSGPISIYFKNEYGEEGHLDFIDVIRPILPIELSPEESVNLGQTVLDLPKAENYKILGKHSIYMVDGNLISDTITIKVIEKK